MSIFTFGKQGNTWMSLDPPPLIAGGVRYDLQKPGTERTAAVEVVAYRIALESFTNIIKHAEVVLLFRITSMINDGSPQHK